jgi:aspartate racemase
MKIIGLIGGMSWESSLEYYRIINEMMCKKLGGFHSAKSMMYSVNFADIELLQHQSKWDEATKVMIDAARKVESGGADFIVICTNTMHKMVEEIQRHINIPILHIADATANEIKSTGLSKIGLLGTKFTMEESFYTDRLIERHGLQVLIPTKQGREFVHRVLYDEFISGDIPLSSKLHFIKIMDQLVEQGAEGIILGCTEIGLFINQQDVNVPLFDTTRIHATVAVEYALGEFDPQSHN